jgi:homoserine dehydrogenase
VKPGQIHTEGIRHISQAGHPVCQAARLHDPSARRREDSFRPKSRSVRTAVRAIQVAVYPALVPNAHVLASVNYAFNAISVRGDVVGDTLFYGRGAGAGTHRQLGAQRLGRRQRST